MRHVLVTRRDGCLAQEELPSGPLSLCEREVLHLLAQGQTNREVARSLTVSVSTAKIHVEHILAKR
jgi:DNA-binding CsgD family transcriptional regulator